MWLDLQRAISISAGDQSQSNLLDQSDYSLLCHFSKLQLTVKVKTYIVCICFYISIFYCAIVLPGRESLLLPYNTILMLSVQCHPQHENTETELSVKCIKFRVWRAYTPRVVKSFTSAFLIDFLSLKISVELTLPFIMLLELLLKLIKVLIIILKSSYSAHLTDVLSGCLLMLLYWDLQLVEWTVLETVLCDCKWNCKTWRHLQSCVL